MRDRWVRISAWASLEGVLGVQRSLAPCRFAFVVLVGEYVRPSVTALGHSGGDRGSSLGIVVEEGPGDARPDERRPRH
jgi:hypothetical protein